MSVIESKFRAGQQRPNHLLGRRERIGVSFGEILFAGGDFISGRPSRESGPVGGSDSRGAVGLLLEDSDQAVVRISQIVVGELWAVREEQRFIDADLEVLAGQLKLAR